MGVGKKERKEKWEMRKEIGRKERRWEKKEKVSGVVVGMRERRGERRKKNDESGL